MLAAAALLALATTAGPSAPSAMATVEATARTLLDAALDHLGIADTSSGAIGALEPLVADAIRTGVLDHGVLTVVAGQDPTSVPLFVCAHERRERERWADVGPVWTRAYGALGLTPGGCDPSDDAPCGLVLRLRLMTDAGRELAAREDCDLDCAHRLGRLRDRLVVTAREVARLDLEELGAGVDTADDTAQLIDEADATILALSERIRIAEERAPVPDPGFDPDEECEPTPRPTP